MKINMPVLQPIQFDKMTAMLETIKLYTRKWLIYENYFLDIPGHPTIFIPKNFIFDGASIPKIFRIFLSPVGVLLIPGLIHDYGYFYNTLYCMKNGRVQPYMSGAGKASFDKLFLEVANEVNGLTKINKSAYLAVKYFGGFAWKSHKDTQLF
jgi:hypothetical protein